MLWAILFMYFPNQSLHAQGLGTASTEQVGKDVEEALLKANSTGLAGLTLTKAVLTLETAGSKEGGLKLNFLIFTIEHTTKKSSTMTQTLTFGSIAKVEGAGAAPLESLKETLEQAIAGAAQIASQIKTLPPAEVTIKMQFAVQKVSDWYEPSGLIMNK